MRDEPVAAPDAFVASSAVLAGDVRVGPGTVIDHGALIAAAAGVPVDSLTGPRAALAERSG